MGTKTVYHFTCAKYGLEAIEKRRIKVSRLAELNDPFEYYGAVLSNKELRDWVKGEKKITSKKYGMICCSDTWQNPVMWTHYARRNTGICLGFEVSEHLQKVNYVDKRIAVPQSLERALSPKLKYESQKFKDDLAAMGDISKFKLDGAGYIINPDESLTGEQKITKENYNFLMGLQHTKYEHWQYEGEYRIWRNLKEFTKEGALYFADFSADKKIKLKYVIVGLHSRVTRQDVSNALGKQMRDKVIRFKVRESFRDFKMVKNIKSKMWK